MKSRDRQDNFYSSQPKRTFSQIVFYLLLTVICLSAQAPLYAANLASDSSQGTAKALPPSSSTPTGGQGKAFFFGKDLLIDHDLVFHGQQATQSIDFSWPRNWLPRAGGTLYLHLSHSPGLIPQLSYISVELNGTSLKTLRLDASNEAGTDVAVSINPALLKDYNSIALKVGQHYQEDCEDPYSAILWTQVGRESRFVFNYAQAPLALNLQNWPFPIVDLRTLGKSEVAFALPQSTSLETARAIAEVSSAIGAHASYRPLDVTTDTRAVAPLIAVGTAQESSLVALLEEKLPPDLNWQAGGGNLPQDTGLLALVPSPFHPNLACLIVSGNSSKGVLKAAQALASQELNPILGGQAALVQKVSVKNVQPLSAPNTKGLMPSSKNFSLRDLGYNTTTVHGVSAETLVVDANTLPGIKVFGQSQKLRVVFGYSAQVNPDLSAFEIKLNKVSLRSYALSQTAGEEHHEDLVEIPNQLLGTHNRFEFIFHLYPKRIGKCEPLIDKPLWGTLYDTTKFEIDREYLNGLPDLSLLEYQGYPFCQDKSGDQTSVVLPSQTNPATLGGLLKLSSLMGQWTGRSWSNVYFDKSLPEDVRAKSNLIVLDPARQNAFVQSLSTVLTLNNSEKLEKIFVSKNGNELTVSEREHNGFLEEVLSPWASGKLVLLCQANSIESFNLAINSIFDPALRHELRGSLASVSPELIIKGVQATPLSSASTISPWRQVMLFISENPWIAALLIFLAIFILTANLRKWLASRKSP
jgi:hypothetical protein